MKIQTMIATLAAAAVLNTLTLPAQVSTQELYTVKFRATCTPSDNANGRGSKMTDRELIEECVGTGLSRKELKRNYALVYNPATDSLQVVSRSDGSLVCEALIFEGGTNAVSGDRLSRFTFVFSPNQAEAIGSAVITERTRGESGRARISGRLQFTRVAHNGGQTNTTDAVGGTMESSDTSSISVPNPEGTASTNSDDGSRNLADTIENSNSGSDTNSNDIGQGGSSGDNNEGSGGDNGNNGGSSGDFVQASAAAVAASPGEVEICVGTFTAGKLFRAGGNNTDDDGDNNTGGDADTPGTGNIGGNNGDNGSSTNNPSTNALNGVDTRFVNQAAQSGLLEVELATLALQNSTNEAVRAYAEELIQDHTESNQQLAQIAGSKGLTVPTTLDTSGQNAVNRLSNLTGTQFDRQFANQAVSTHRQAIQVFENEVERGEDSDLTAFASANLPVLREHLAEAQELQRGGL